MVHDYYVIGEKSVQEVQSFCKTASSIREILITPLLVRILTEHRERQQEQSEQLGHKSVKTTSDIYVHVFKEKKLKEIDKLNALDSIVL